MRIININGKDIKVESVNPKEAAKRIKKALKVITDKTWSVTNDSGTAYGWLTIMSPVSRRIARIANPNYNSDSDNFQDIPMAFNYSPLTKDFKLDKEEAYYMNREDMDALEMFNYTSQQGVSINPRDTDYYVYLLENYETIEAERLELEKKEELAFEKAEEIYEAEYASCVEMGNIEITEDMIVELPHNKKVVKALMPNTYNQESIDGFRSYLENSDYQVIEVMVKAQVNLTNEQYDMVTQNLKSNQEVLLGGVSTTSDIEIKEDFTDYNDEEKVLYLKGLYQIVTKLTAPDRETVYANTHGYSYIRYLYFTLIDDDIDVQSQSAKYSPVIANPNTLISSLMDRI